MVCYAVPALVAFLSVGFGRRCGLRAKYAQWFTLLFTGGSVFGVVDHLWNGELFLIGPNVVDDLMLGVTIAAALFVAWALAVRIDQMTVKSPQRA